MSTESITLILTILGSVGASAFWLTSQITELKTEMKHALKRIGNLERAVFRFVEDGDESELQLPRARKARYSR